MDCTKDHHELDDTPELDLVGIKQYQSLIGALQWLVTLGRSDLLLGATAMSLCLLAQISVKVSS